MTQTIRIQVLHLLPQSFACLTITFQIYVISFVKQAISYKIISTTEKIENVFKVFEKKTFKIISKARKK